MVNLRFFLWGYRFTARIFDLVYEASILHNLAPDRCFVLSLPLKRIRIWPQGSGHAIRFYPTNKTVTHIQYEPRSMPNSVSPPAQVDSLTFYPLPQILCRLLRSHIFDTDYQPLPRKATTMAEYLCEG